MDLDTAITVAEGLNTKNSDVSSAITTLISAAKSNYQADMQSIKDAQVAMKGAQDEADALRTQASVDNDTIKALSEDKTSLESKVADNEKTISDLTVERDGLVTDKADLTQKIKTFITVSQSASASLSDVTKSASSSLADVANKISDISNSLTQSLAPVDVTPVDVTP